MKLVKVDAIRDRRVPNQMLQSLIKEFVNGDAQTMQVVFEKDEYSDAHSCYNAFRKAIKISGYARIRVATKCGNVYLIKDYNE